MPLVRIPVKPTAATAGRAGARGWLRVLTLLVALAPAFVAAAPPDAALADCRLTVRARDALGKDKALADLTVGVSVRDHVATLWGAVPSKELSRRAAECVRRVPGIADVVNQLVVERAGDPLPEFLRAGPAKPQAAGRPAALTGKGDDPRVVPPLIWHPAHRGDNPRGVSPPVALMPAVPLPAAATPPADDLAHAVERLRQADPRLRGVRAEVRGGVVRLGGRVYAWPDLYDFAKAVAQLPGVERVILGGVTLDPSGPPH